MTPRVALNAMREAARMELPAGAAAVPEYYDRRQFWPAESLQRRDALPGPT